MKMKKRLIAMLMIMLMVFSMLPASALAATDGTHAHSFDDYGARVQPTCTETGTGYRQCTICGQGESYTIPALGHAWGGWQTTKEPTCTESGTQQRTCSRCGATETGTIPALCHAWGHYIVTEEPTCTESGKRKVYCNRCGASYSETLPALGHDMGEWYTVTEPTENAPGEEHRDCSRCDYYEVRYIDKDNIVHGVEASLTISEFSAPVNGVFYSPEDNTATISYVLKDSGDYTIKNVSIYHEGAVLSSSPVMYKGDYIFDSFKLTMDPITGPGTWHVYLYATFVDEQGNSYTVYSNTLELPVGIDGEDGKPERGSYLTLELSEPTLPACGFFTEGSVICLDARVTAKSGDVYNVSLYGGSSQSNTNYSHIAKNDAKPYYPEVTITNEDCLKGYKDVMAEAYYTNDCGASGVVFSNVVRIPCGIYGFESDRAFSLSLMEVSIPENYYEKTLEGLAPFYQEGETIWLQLLLTDTDSYLTGNNMDDVYAELFMNNPKFKQLTTVNDGSYIFADYNYKVTAKDVKNGYITADGFANVVDSNFGAWQLSSNSLMIPCGREDSVLEAELSILSAPANGSYFVPGEQVYFVLYVKNTGDTTIKKISVTDALMGEVGWIQSMPAGDVQLIEFVYTVTDKDAENGSFNEFCKADGKGASAVSNMIVVPCGEGVLTGQNDVQVFKLLYPGCEPANGIRFTEGEKLSYYIIVTNCTEQTLCNIAVHDSRAPDYEAIIEKLEPGESDTVSYFDTVSADDVASGWALNTAAVLWMDEGATYHISTSNVVAVPAGLNGSVLYSDGESPMCRTTLIGETDGAYQYEQSLCPEHQAVMEAVTQLFEGCDSLEAYYAAYESMRQLWTDSLNALYDEWIAAVSGDYYVAAVKDRDAFFAMLEAYEKALPARGIDDEMYVNLFVSEIVKGKCLELCYELHTAPEPNPASWMQEGIPEFEAFFDDTCVSYSDELVDSCFNFTDTYCEAHGKLLETALANVKNAKNDNEALVAWSFARTIARAQLQKSYAEMAANADEASIALLREDSAKLIEYLTQREETLKLYRSDDYMTLSEAYVRGLISRIALNCMSQF